MCLLAWVEQVFRWVLEGLKRRLPLSLCRGNLGSLLGSFYKGAVLYWGPKQGPEFRELPLDRWSFRI